MGLVTSTPSAEAVTPGGGFSGGVRIHLLRPLTHAFQAEVAFGSTCHDEPERVPPMISHLWSGRYGAGNDVKRSRDGAK